MDGGFVYVMSTPSMPGIFKIGQTTNITKRRAQLSSSTATPMPFNCAYKVFTPQHVEFEKALHKELEPFRVNDSKEFFQCPLEIIKHAFQVAHYKRFGTLCPAPDTIPETDPDTAYQPPETQTMRTAPQPAPRNPSPLTGDQITAALETYFGFSTFRPGQRQIIEQLLAGQSSAAVFPTGSGKSLCYQLPGLLLPGLTLVISPLIALMKDQIDALLAKGIQAARLDSTLTNNEYQEVMRGVRGGGIKILYVAPERFMNERFRSAMQGIRISLFAVDEAHCVSEWGHNFRPDYLKLSLFARSFGAECILALTATATPEVLKDICRSFDIETIHAVCTGFYRPNLTLLTMPIENSRRDDQLLDDLRRQPAGPTIIYVTQQNKAEEVAQMLFENGLQAKAYHAGMKTEDRTATQEWFIQSKAGIVVATIAFGMGIDKADIRYVYHYNLPKSLENYSQEIGRAGRDGVPSLCKLFACPDDMNVLENFVYGDTPTMEAMQNLITFVFSHTQSGFDISLDEASDTFDIRTLVLKTIMTRLELAGYVEAGTPFHAKYQIKTLLPWEEIVKSLPEDRRSFLRAMTTHMKKARLWSDLDIEGAITGMKTSRSRIVAELTDLAEQQVIELKTANFRTPYRIMNRPQNFSELASSLHSQMLDREMADLQRLNKVLDWAVLHSCQTRALGEYFGEKMEGNCGHCSACLGDKHMMPTRREPPHHILEKIVESAHELQRAHPELNLDPVSLTRFFCGISSPKLIRAKLGPRHQLFGIRSDTPFNSILKIIKQGNMGR